MSTLPAKFTATLEQVIPPEDGYIGLHEPQFAGAEWKYVTECLDSGWVSSVGSYVDRFEADLAKYTGAAAVVATVNGTAALQTCLQLSGVIAGDEVLIPALTFVATANAAHYLGAVPHFVDIEPQSFGVDPDKLADYLKNNSKIIDGFCHNKKSGNRISALVVVHIFGHPAPLDELAAVCDQYNIKLVEDAAEGLGSFYKDIHVGRHSDYAALSFNGNKIITTGGGGAILCRSLELAKKAKHLTTTARADEGFSLAHDEVGYNFRMPNLNAALGCAQLEQLPKWLTTKRKLAQRYQKYFADFSELSVLDEPKGAKSNFWLNAILLDRANVGERDAILTAAKEARYLLRPAWRLMHRLPMYKNSPRADLSNALDLQPRLINLPSTPRLLATS